MQHLKQLNNFHVLSALVCAFSNSAVLRLKFTRARLSKRHRQMLADVESVMSMESSYKQYRKELSCSSPPCIPFLGVYLTDLTFIGDGNPDMIDGKRINFAKHKLCYGVIATIQAYQKVPYNLETVDAIQNFLRELPQLDEKKIYANSLECEPRGADRSDIK